MDAPGEPLDTWFAREILAHEAALTRYLTRVWSHRDDVHDLRQEAYIRVYEAVAKAGPTQRPIAPKSFLFATAKNLMADRVRRARIVSIETTGDIDALIVPMEELTPERHANTRQELRRLATALDQLPPRCRDVIWMRKVEQLPQKEVASRMGISEGAVEKHITKGIRALADALYGNDATAEDTTPTAQTSRENEHG